MPNYENVFIARQDITAAQVEGLVETFEKAITDGGGSVPKKEIWGLKTLAYKIKKNRKGHYTLMNIDAPADAVHEMERQMRINEDVLRYMTIRVDELEEGPSAMVRSRERDDRPRRGERDDRPRRGRDDRDRGPRRDEAPKESPKEAVTESEPVETTVDAPVDAPVETKEKSEGDEA